MIRRLGYLPGLLLLGYVGGSPLIEESRALVQVVGCILAMLWILSIEWRLYRASESVKTQGAALAVGSAAAVGMVMQSIFRDAINKPASEPGVLQVEEDEDDDDPPVPENERCASCGESMRSCVSLQRHFDRCCSLCVCKTALAAADLEKAEESKRA